MTVTPILVLADGSSHTLQPVILQPAGVVSINLNRAFSALALPAEQSAQSFGTVGLHYSWYWNGAISGEVQIVDSDRSLSYSSGLRNEPQEGTAQKQAIEGVWWRRSANTGGYLRLTDVSAEPLTVSVSFLDDMSSSAVGRAETLRPGETRMIELKALLDSVAGMPLQGGLKISFSGASGALAVDGGLEDTANGFSTRLVLGAIKKTDSPAKVIAAKQVTLASVGMMMGRPGADMMFPHPLTFHPYLMLRNAAGDPRTVTISANYMYGTAAITTHLMDVSLRAGATRKIDADAAIQALHLNPLIGYVNLVYSFAGDKSDVLVSAGSVDGTGTYVFETPAAPTIHSMSRTICHWELGDGVDTMFTIWNHGSGPEDLLLTFNYEGGEYSKPVHLEAKASVMLSLEDLIARGQPDVKGRFLPINLTEGSAKVSGSRGEVEHIDAAVAVASYNVNKATCTVKCVHCGQTAYTVFYNAPGLFQLPEGSIKQSTAIGKSRSGGTYDVTSAVIWSSSNTTMFTVGTGSSMPGLVAALTPGKGLLSFESLPVQDVGVACGDPPVCDGADTMQISTDMTVDDTTPIITGIDPSDWTAGATTPSVAFTGQYFGTNTPALTFSPAAGISYALLSHSDTQIVANITVASGTPNEDVQVSVTSTGYGGSSFTSGSGASPTSSPANASVHSPMNTPEVTVVGWVDSNFSLPTGENSALQSTLGTTIGCVAQITALVTGHLGLVTTPPDVPYMNVWLVQNSANYNSLTNPPHIVITPSVIFSMRNFRLFNDFGHGGGAVRLGRTPDPCKTGYFPGVLEEPEPSPYLGLSNTLPSGSVYQLAEGRVGRFGQLGSFTLNGRGVPWIWSLIEFDAHGTPTYNNVAQFPTYSVYINGYLQTTYPQSSVASFTALDEKYQLTPAQIQ